jgi:hypothetical protein
MRRLLLAIVTVALLSPVSALAQTNLTVDGGF